MTPISFSLLDFDELAALRQPAVGRRGVYFLWVGDEIVYIGKSVNLNVRVAAHASYWEFRGRPTITGVSFIEIPEGSIDTIEVLYINKFKPQFNKDGTK